MIRFINYYEILEISPTTKPRAIELAFRKRILKLDYSISENVDTSQAFRDTNEAYLVLTNEEARIVFDKLAAIYNHGDLIPGASSNTLESPKPASATIAGVLSNYLHSEFYNTYFRHFIARQVEIEKHSVITRSLLTLPRISYPKNLPSLALKLPAFSYPINYRYLTIGFVVVTFLAIVLSFTISREPSAKELLSQFSQATTFEKVHLAKLISRQEDAKETTLEPLLLILKDSNQEVVVRSAVAKALAEIAGNETVVQNALIDAVHSPQSFLRIHATTALGLIEKPSKETTQTFFQSLGDDNQQVRYAAGKAIAAQGAKFLEENISESSKSKKPVMVAKHSTDQLNFETALADLADPEPKIRIAAIDALRTHSEKSNEVTAKLIPMLDDPEAPVVVAAAGALGFLREESAIWPLLSLLADEDSSVRTAVANALNNIPEEKVTLALNRSLKKSALDIEEKKERSAPLLALPTTQDKDNQIIAMLPTTTRITESYLDYPPSSELIEKMVNVGLVHSATIDLLPPSLVIAKVDEIPDPMAPPFILLASAKPIPPFINYRIENPLLYPDIDRLTNDSTIVALQETDKSAATILANLSLREEQQQHAKLEVPKLAPPSISSKIDLAKLSPQSERAVPTQAATPKMSPGESNKRSTLIANLTIRNEPIPRSELETPLLSAAALNRSSTMLAKLDVKSVPIPQSKLETPNAVETESTQLLSLAKLTPKTVSPPPIATTQEDDSAPVDLESIVKDNKLKSQPWANAVKIVREELGSKNRKLSVVALIEDKNEKFQTLGSIVIAQRGFATASELNTLKQRLKSKNPHVQAAAAWAIAEVPGITGEDLERQLGKMIKSKNYWINLHAARALGRIGTSTAQELLKQRRLSSS